MTRFTDAKFMQALKYKEMHMNSYLTVFLAVHQDFP